MELATIVSIGKLLVVLCYDNERDGKLQCAKTYDRWNSTLDHLTESVAETTRKERRAVLLPEVHDNAVALSGGDDALYKVEMDKAIKAIRVVQQYMKTYTDKDIERTLRILRACRMFNFFFVAETNIEVLEEEMVHLQNIAYFTQDVTDELKMELAEYKRAAQDAVAKVNQELNEEKKEVKKDLWKFWKRNQLVLKKFWLAALEIAIFQPSSAFIERVFSYFRQGFDDTQELALEDMKETGTMMRCNENQREKEKEKERNGGN